MFLVTCVRISVGCIPKSGVTEQSLFFISK